MFKNLSYPIICTDKYAETVGFYEDGLNFEPIYEEDEKFITLRRRDNHDQHLSVISMDYKWLREKDRRVPAGLILFYGVDDLEKTYDQFYLDGMNVVSEIQTSPDGAKYFLMEDPNEILIALCQNVSEEFYEGLDNLVVNPKEIFKDN